MPPNLSWSCCQIFISFLFILFYFTTRTSRTSFWFWKVLLSWAVFSHFENMNTLARTCLDWKCNYYEYEYGKVKLTFMRNDIWRCMRYAQRSERTCKRKDLRWTIISLVYGSQVEIKTKKQKNIPRSPPFTCTLEFQTLSHCFLPVLLVDGQGSHWWRHGGNWVVVGCG